jgi:hypothetical protein
VRSAREKAIGEPVAASVSTTHATIGSPESLKPRRLVIRGVADDAVSSDTRIVRYTDIRVCTHFPTSQAWQFRERGKLIGDALIVLVDDSAYAVIRIGKKVSVEWCPRGIRGVLENRGFETVVR